jgi:DNA topoisomerase I
MTKEAPFRSAKQPGGNSYTCRYVLQPAQSAEAAGLRYVSDAAPGIRRIAAAGRGFRFLDAQGKPIRDRGTLARIRSLAIPPAWSHVWISPRDDGHLQATGRDARGRKQYRYHRRWREVRDETKYGRMLAFAKALPAIHRRVRHDLALSGLPRAKALAAVVHLLEATCIRVGNEEYARHNESFGLTTLRSRQVRVQGDTLKFKFRGKSGVPHEVEMSDRRMASIVRRMRDLPGQELFQYVDDAGETHAIESADVNAYLKEVAGDEFTSKDFRTWAGTLYAAEALRRLPTVESAGQAKRNVLRVIEAVAGQLRNTSAVCRKCYIHPAVLDSYLEGSLNQAMQGRSAVAGVVALLQARARLEANQAKKTGAFGTSLAPVLARSVATLPKGSSRNPRSLRAAKHPPKPISTSPPAARPSAGAP